MSRTKMSVVAGGRWPANSAGGWNSPESYQRDSPTVIEYSLGGGDYLRPDIPLVVGSGAYAPIGCIDEHKCSSQRQRRARILAIARKLLLETGYQTFTVRELAEQSEVTVPTIYNLVGGRIEVMMTAIKEQYLANLALYKRKAAAANTPAIFFLMDHHKEVATCYTNYVRQIFLGAFADNSPNPLSEGITDMLRASYGECFYAMGKRGQFKAFADINLLTSTFTCVHLAFTNLWTMGHVRLEDKQRLFEYDVAMVLRGVVADHFIPCVDRRLAEVRKPCGRSSARAPSVC
jgi:AcrR family transcriptional regulator